MKAGFGQIDITPGGRPYLNGFASRRQPSTGVAAPVMARVVLLAGSRSRAVIAVCDTLGFTVADSQRLERAIGTVVGIPVKNVFLACTHTHSGPMSMPLGPIAHFDSRYVDMVERRLCKATVASSRDLDVVTAARFGEADVSSLGRFRCRQDEPGRARWPGEVSALRIEREEKPPITLWHMGVHPYVLGFRSRVMHPDYPGPGCAAVERRTGGHSIFLPGCGADVSPMPGMTASITAVERYGRRVAQAVERGLRSGNDVALEPLRLIRIVPRIEFGYIPSAELGDSDEEAMQALSAADQTWKKGKQDWFRAFQAGCLPRTSRFPIHLLRLGPILLAGMPAELFYDTGMLLQRALRPAHVLATAHTGGNVGYLPRPFAYRRGTYEVRESFQWYGTAGAVARRTEASVRKAVVSAARRVMC